AARGGGVRDRPARRADVRGAGPPRADPEPSLAVPAPDAARAAAQARWAARRGERAGAARAPPDPGGGPGGRARVPPRAPRARRDLGGGPPHRGAGSGPRRAPHGGVGAAAAGRRWAALAAAVLAHAPSSALGPVLPAALPASPGRDERSGVPRPRPAPRSGRWRGGRR